MEIKIALDLLQDIAYDAGLTDDDIRTDYSGRGMYGAACVGITGTTGDFGRFMVALARHVERDGQDLDWTADDWAEQLNKDSMGYDSIFYFPRVQVATDGVGDPRAAADHDYLAGRGRY